jgi:hypothetical protein
VVSVAAATGRERRRALAAKSARDRVGEKWVFKGWLR